MRVEIEIEWDENAIRPKDCVCPQSGISAKCRHHGRWLAEWGWDQDGKIVHIPMEWSEEAKDWMPTWLVSA